jgi:hypothetical protein
LQLIFLVFTTQKSSLDKIIGTDEAGTEMWNEE